MICADSASAAVIWMKYTVNILKRQVRPMTAIQVKEKVSATISGALSGMHREKENSSVHGLLVLFRKELADHLRSTRFLLMTALLTLTSMASLYGALSNIRDQPRKTVNLFSCLCLLQAEIPCRPYAPFWRFSARWQGLSWALTVVNRSAPWGH